MLAPAIYFRDLPQTLEANVLWPGLSAKKTMAWRREKKGEEGVATGSSAPATPEGDEDVVQHI